MSGWRFKRNTLSERSIPMEPNQYVYQINESLDLSESELGLLQRVLQDDFNQRSEHFEYMNYTFNEIGYDGSNPYVGINSIANKLGFDIADRISAHIEKVKTLISHKLQEENVAGLNTGKIKLGWRLRYFGRCHYLGGLSRPHTDGLWTYSRALVGAPTWVGEFGREQFGSAIAIGPKTLHESPICKEGRIVLLAPLEGKSDL